VPYLIEASGQHMWSNQPTTLTRNYNKYTWWNPSIERMTTCLYFPDRELNPLTSGKVIRGLGPPTPTLKSRLWARHVEIKERTKRTNRPMLEGPIYRGPPFLKGKGTSSRTKFTFENCGGAKTLQSPIASEGDTRALGCAA